MSGSVKVMFFASLREDVGVSELQLEAADTQELMQTLGAQLSAEAMLALAQDNVRMAINQQLIEGTVRLQQGDEVAFLPPVTGG